MRIRAEHFNAPMIPATDLLLNMLNRSLGSRGTIMLTPRRSYEVAKTNI